MLHRGHHISGFREAFKQSSKCFVTNRAARFDHVVVAGTSLFSSDAKQRDRINVKELIVSSRYEDVPISEKPYFDFVWENRAKHSNKIAMVRNAFLFIENMGLANLFP